MEMTQARTAWSVSIGNRRRGPYGQEGGGRGRHGDRGNDGDRRRGEDGLEPGAVQRRHRRGALKKVTSAQMMSNANTAEPNLTTQAGRPQAGPSLAPEHFPCGRFSILTDLQGASIGPLKIKS